MIQDNQMGGGTDMPRDDVVTGDIAFTLPGRPGEEGGNPVPRNPPTTSGIR